MRERENERERREREAHAHLSCLDATHRQPHEEHMYIFSPSSVSTVQKVSKQSRRSTWRQSP